MDMQEMVDLIIAIIRNGGYAVAWERYIALGLGVAIRVCLTRAKKYLSVEIGTELPGSDNAGRVTLVSIKA